MPASTEGSFAVKNLRGATARAEALLVGGIVCGAAADVPSPADAWGVGVERPEEVGGQDQLERVFDFRRVQDDIRAIVQPGHRDEKRQGIGLAETLASNEALEVALVHGTKAPRRVVDEEVAQIDA